MIAPETGQRGNRAPVIEVRHGLALRQTYRHPAARSEREGNCEPEHGAPAAMRRDQPGDRPAQQNTGQKSRHDGPHHLPALLGRSDVGGEGDDLLRHRRGEAERQRSGDQPERIGRDRRRGKRNGEPGELNQNQPPTLDQIPERNKEEQAKRVAKLRRGGHQPGQPIGYVGLHQAEHGLVIIYVGNGDPRRHGHGKGEAAHPGAANATRFCLGNSLCHRLYPAGNVRRHMDHVKIGYYTPDMMRQYLDL